MRESKNIACILHFFHKKGERPGGAHLFLIGRENLLFILNKLLAARKHEARDDNQNEEWKYCQPDRRLPLAAAGEKGCPLFPGKPSGKR